jgi:hypothetical protein
VYIVHTLLKCADRTHKFLNLIVGIFLKKCFYIFQGKFWLMCLLVLLNETTSMKHMYGLMCEFIWQSTLFCSFGIWIFPSSISCTWM